MGYDIAIQSRFGSIWYVENEDLLGAWSFSEKFLFNGFVWFGLGRSSDQVVADDCICGSEIFLVSCRSFILVMVFLSTPFRFNTFVFYFMI